MNILRDLLLAFAVYVVSVVLCATGGGLLGKLIASWFPHYYPSVFPSAASQPWFDATEVGIGLGIGQGAVAGLAVGSVVVLSLALVRRKRTAGGE